MNNNVKKILGVGAIGVFALITLLNTQAIGKLSNSNNVTYSYQAESSDPMSVQETDSSLFSGIDQQDLVAQVKGGTTCGTAVASILPLPSYILNDGQGSAPILKFRITNTTNCEFEIQEISFVNLTKTNANVNWAKLYVVNSLTGAVIQTYPHSGNSMGPIPLGVNFNDIGIQAMFTSPLSLPAGQNIILELRADYIRNTNISEDVGVTGTDDYFLMGIDKIFVTESIVNFSINPKFDKQPVKILP